ncbi:hypothetical protein BD770DRAFT_425367 [Pilaira anomala]|nr:hypothetical protein BD770DRAFT_425367 [Pilaira anomala]
MIALKLSVIFESSFSHTKRVTVWVHLDVIMKCYTLLLNLVYLKCVTQFDKKVWSMKPKKCSHINNNLFSRTYVLILPQYIDISIAFSKKIVIQCLSIRNNTTINDTAKPELILKVDQPREGRNTSDPKKFDAKVQQNCFHNSDPSTDDGGL